MKVSLSWLKELVDYQLTPSQLADKLSLSSIGVKQQTEDYLELDLTYNRGDLLSLRGVAYEVSAITDAALRFLSEDSRDFVWVGQNLEQIKVEIKDNNLAPVYCLAKIEGLKVEPSNPDWQKKLNDSGIRSINNLADITNLVMIEYGQPMHSFDAGKVEGSIIVRSAQEGEKIITLDGKERDLSTQDVVIADEQKAIGIAGIMGGENTEVTSQTTSILLEAAIFDPAINRASSKRHGLYSEATKRFQHGLSPLRTLQALDAAIKMYQQLGGKLTSITLIGNFTHPTKIVPLNIDRVNKLIGLFLDEQTITDCLRKLGFVVRKKEEGILEVLPPYFRLDTNIEEDLAEEVARMYGYEKIEGIPLQAEEVPGLDQSLPNFIYDLKLKLKDLGLTEVQSYPFYSSAVLEALGSISDYQKSLVKIANPISSETENMRMDLWPNLLEVISKSIKKGYKDVAIFEIGKIYSISFEEGETQEADAFSIALFNDSQNPLEELVSIVKKLDLGLELSQSAAPKLVQNLVHPNRFIHIKKGDKDVGGLAEINLKILNNLGIEQRVAVLDINPINLIS